MVRTFESKIIHVLESGFDLAGCLRLKMVMMIQTPSQMRIENCLKSNAPILAFEMFEN